MLRLQCLSHHQDVASRLWRQRVSRQNQMLTSCYWTRHVPHRRIQAGSDTCVQRLDLAHGHGTLGKLIGTLLHELARSEIGSGHRSSKTSSAFSLARLPQFHIFRTGVCLYVHLCCVKCLSDHNWGKYRGMADTQAGLSVHEASGGYKKFPRGCHGCNTA
jgi:hypothetical protein